MEGSSGQVHTERAWRAEAVVWGLLLVIIVLVMIIGKLMSFIRKSRKWKDASTQTEVSRESVKVQSQCTYRRDLQRPRFQVTGQAD
eukprot:1523364-Amphidinium_carterae.1